MPIERGEVYWVTFEFSMGGEVQRTRPAVIMSNNSSNMALNRVQVVPITSKTDRLHPGEAIVQLRGERRKAMASQLATASKLRLGAKLGALALADVKKVEDAIAVQLGLVLK